MGSTVQMERMGSQDHRMPVERNGSRDRRRVPTDLLTRQQSSW
jgi:hypothetical protein